MKVHTTSTKAKVSTYQLYDSCYAVVDVHVIVRRRWGGERL
jgi:hypothetical protein